MDESKSRYLTNISEKGDSDNTATAKNFYCNFWEGLHNAEYISNLDKGAKIFELRGETLISFGTIAGCMIRLLPSSDLQGKGMPTKKMERLELIVQSKNVEEKLKEKFNYFYKIYHSLANFMPLVKTKKSVNLNNIKGDATGKYHDFPDLFLRDVQNYYLDFECKSEKFAYAVNASNSLGYKTGREANIEYFGYFGVGKEGWNQFVEANYLQCFFEDEGYTKFKVLTPTLEYFPYRKPRKKLAEEQVKECLIEIDVFLTTAIEIIEERSSILEEEEKRKLI